MEGIKKGGQYKINIAPVQKTGAIYFVLIFLETAKIFKYV